MNFNELFERITPYIALGIAIVFFIVMFLFLSYIAIWGILIGAVLYFFHWLRLKFFINEEPKDERQEGGRIIEHSDHYQ